MTVPFTDRFNAATRRMCVLAMSDAVRLKHPAVGTEHLLCAIMGDPEENRGKHVLLALRVKPAELLQQLLALEIPLSKNKPPLPLAPIAEKVFAKVIEQAATSTGDIGPEHFLLAMTNEDCAAIKMLENLDVNRFALRAMVMNQMGT